MIVWRRILDLPQPHVAHAFVHEGQTRRPVCSFAKKHGWKMVPCPRPDNVLGACMACWRYATHSAAVQAVPVATLEVGASEVVVDLGAATRLVER